MEVVKIETVDAEAPQRFLARCPDVLRRGIVLDVVGARIMEHQSTLRRQHHIVAPPGDGSPDQLLVDEGAVDIGGIEQVCPEIDGALDDPDGFALMRPPVGPVQAHAAEADGTHRQAGCSQGSLLHENVSLSLITD
jgi:hypothetical protein